jgi:hypothetical protein
MSWLSSIVQRVRYGGNSVIRVTAKTKDCQVVRWINPYKIIAVIPLDTPDKFGNKSQIILEDSIIWYAVEDASDIVREAGRMLS